MLKENPRSACQPASVPITFHFISLHAIFVLHTVTLGIERDEIDLGLLASISYRFYGNRYDDGSESQGYI
jgi:hypothetical protein